MSGRTIPRSSARSYGSSSEQNADGGWGESNDSYAQQARPAEDFASTPYQTAWALLGLLSAGEASSDAARRGAEFLMHTQTSGRICGTIASFTAPGFPRVFYLRYHGYSAYFPVWALAAYRNADAARNRSLSRGLAH